MAISLPETEKKSILKSPQTGLKPAIASQNLLSFGFRGKIKPKEILFFASQLSLMAEIDTPINRALTAIRNQTENSTFKGVIQQILQDVEDGRQLSDAMSQHPRVFNKVFVSMIKAGETVGLLKEILDRIVEMEERRQELIAQVRSALMYPLVLCAVSILVVVFILIGVLPKFTAFFAGRESILPLTTRWLIALSASLKAYWWAYLMFLAALAVAIKIFKQSEVGASLLDRFLIAGPIIGNLTNKIYNCQMLRLLGNLMESHVPLLEALEVTLGTIGNRYFREFIDTLMRHVKEGGSFAQPFADYAFTLESVKQMVAIGEESGRLPRVMLRLSEFYDAEVDRELKTLAAMIEPMALVIMGTVVGLIVSSVILPLFRLAHVVH
ncbi:MAG: type II secretion system F family protein [Deltaproteobacteria bacterium]|nr:type II secretion system F family protein [Deltaproteobacteria bacterium]MBW1962299.1 type II secretion system F family protein [Deltaproteobacteria bacterium]MBW2150571.1 type II secretion system F family protein [Deltaproteobacteria bacterium]